MSINISERHGQSPGRLRIGIACNAETQRFYIASSDLDRLTQMGDVVMMEYDLSTGWDPTPQDREIENRLVRIVSDLDVLLLGPGGPRVTERVLAAARRLTMVGDLEGDRRGGRIDLQAAKAAGVMVVDTTHASSQPVAEWALALTLVGLRQHARFRGIISGQKMSYADYKTDPPGRELTGKRVGMIGFGHIAWRLRELLSPFDVSVTAFDPHAPRELADALKIDHRTGHGRPWTLK